MTDRTPPVPASPLDRLAQRLRATPSPRVQRLLLAVAVLVFVAGAIMASRHLDLAPGDLRWTPLLLATFVAVPLSVLVNGLEYAVSARIVGHRLGVREAIGVSLVASAANLLPLPGSALVRIQALAGNGVRYRAAASSTLLVGLVWLGVSAVAAGAWLVPAGHEALGAGLLGGGLVALAMAWGLLRRHLPDRSTRRQAAAGAVAVEVASVAVSALRLLLVMVGLGMTASPATALVLALAVVLSSAVGFLPAGIGLREVLGAAMAPLVAVPASAGFLIIAVDRVAGLAGSAPLAGFATAALGRRRS